MDGVRDANGHAEEQATLQVPGVLVEFHRHKSNDDERCREAN